MAQKTWKSIFDRNEVNVFCEIQSVNLERIIAYATLMSEGDVDEMNEEKACEMMDTLRIPLAGPFPEYIRETDKEVSEHTHQHHGHLGAISQCTCINTRTTSAMPPHTR